jgi:DNA-binding NtrC family response regulator
MAVEKILVVDDEPFIRKNFEELLRGKRYGVSSAGTLADAERLLKRDQFDLMFLDVRLPDGEGTEFLERIAKLPSRPVAVMMSGFGTIESAVACMRAGAYDYLLKPFSLSQVDVLVKKVEAYRQMVQVNRYLTEELVGNKDLIGGSVQMERLRAMLAKVAPTEATVLIQGENGTGKELVARAIFNASQRAAMPYVRVNCAAVSETLIESEFFGHEKGAFTGATDRREGRFELANGGTLLLDEISEISPRLQAKLLRVLQEREFERVGGTKTIKVDVRVFATTNRNLLKAVEDGDFREDLYYRLNVFPVHVPPLREREGDVLILSRHFLEEFSRKHAMRGINLSAAAERALLAHRWPGNVRELQNTIERAVILVGQGGSIQPMDLGLPVVATEKVLDAEHVPAARGSAASAKSVASRKHVVAKDVEEEPLDEVEKRHILGVLEKTRGNRTKAAEILSISIRTLRNKLHLYKLD